MQFWSSVDLTGNQTYIMGCVHMGEFWSSVDLTGNQTPTIAGIDATKFWSSVDLTGNQTRNRTFATSCSFGAVSI